jgi:signal transduction histidine kinase
VPNHPSLDDTARHFADVAEQELQRVSHITRQTLSFYRESKQPIPVNLPELLDDVIDLQERPLSASRIRVSKRYLAASIVHGFPVELRQVFLNLIGNAVQAMPTGGTLGVHLREVTDWSRQRRGTAISILDTGIGIQPDDFKRLFQPFFSTKSTKGTGLGLWISKGIIQKYDGTLTCRTFRGQNGNLTCFRVFLPVSGGVPLPPHPTTSTESAGPELETPHPAGAAL